MKSNTFKSAIESTPAGSRRSSGPIVWPGARISRLTNSVSRSAIALTVRAGTPGGPYRPTSRAASVFDAPSIRRNDAFRAHPLDLPHALPARRRTPQDDSLLDERHHASVPDGP